MKNGMPHVLQKKSVEHGRRMVDSAQASMLLVRDSAKAGIVFVPVPSFHNQC